MTRPNLPQLERDDGRWLMARQELRVGVRVNRSGPIAMFWLESCAN